MKDKVKKISFFKKVWYSITKFEEYPTMALEGVKRAIKYLIALTAIVTVFVMVGSLLQMKTLVNDLSSYVKEEIPEFSYVDGKLSMQVDDTIIIEDVQYDGIGKIVIDTQVDTDELKSQIEQGNLTDEITIFFFKDEIVLEARTETDEIIRQSYTYNEVIASYTGENIEKFDKEDFVNYLVSEEMNTFYLSYAITAFVSLLFINIMVTLLDVLEIAILGWITTTIARVRMKFSIIYNLAVYSLTLPMILNIFYMVINYFIDFKITYFQVAYITIAYIYLAAAIFILKDEFIKRMQEVGKIEQEQLIVREEIKQQEEKERENEEEQEQEEKGSLEDGQG